MFFLIFLLIFCLIVYLFCLFVLTKDDFLILRKDISTEEILNFGFLTALVGLFSARFFYVLLNFNPNFLNPFVFFLFTHFPGLSLLGGILGGSIFSLLFLKNKKMLVGHIFDFIAISFLGALAFGSFINLLSIKRIFPFEWLFPFLSLILFLAMIIIYQKTRFKEGNTGVLALISFSAILFLTNHLGKKTFIFNKEDFLLMLFFLVLITFFLKQENLLSRFKKSP